jgi:hypothetical protein
VRVPESCDDANALSEDGCRECVQSISGNLTFCTLFCDGAGNCDTTSCENGAVCRIYCDATTTSCDFASCSGRQMSCGDDEGCNGGCMQL